MLKYIQVLLLSSVCVFVLHAQRPALYLLNADTLLSVQASVFRGEKKYVPALKKLKRDAENALEQKIVTIVDKELIPPSGDKHDYYSLSRYWWPDPNTTDGLPYIRRDGVTNPEIEKIPDNEYLNLMNRSVYTLALAYFFTGEEKFAARASEWIDVWFVRPETRMNPNMRFAQQIRGVVTDRGTGILDAREFSNFVDAVGILRLSKSYPAASDLKVLQWFREYLQWLVESPNGKNESKARNNHGTWYDVQTTAVALFVGDAARAALICETAKAKRIGVQFTPEGKQPEEMVRTMSWHYSQFNLYALTRLAELAKHTGVDLWNYTTEDGRSMRKGLNYLISFLGNEKKWEGKQIKEFTYENLCLTALQASSVYREQTYRKIFDQRFAGNRETDRFMLQYGIAPDNH